MTPTMCSMSGRGVREGRFWREKAAVLVASAFIGVEIERFATSTPRRLQPSRAEAERMNGVQPVVSGTLMPELVSVMTDPTSMTPTMSFHRPWVRSTTVWAETGNSSSFLVDPCPPIFGRRPLLGLFVIPCGPRRIFKDHSHVPLVAVVGPCNRFYAGVAGATSNELTLLDGRILDSPAWSAGATDSRAS